MSLLLVDPGDSVTFQLDWTDVLSDGITLSTVEHAVPSPLTKVSESVASPNSYVRVSGAVHGGLYQVEGAATLSNGESVNRQFPLRCFNG